MSIIYSSPIYGGFGDPSASIYGGEIEIEPERWQIISVPVMYGYWDDVNHQLIHDAMTIATVKNYVIDQIADNMGSPAQNFIFSTHAFIGDVNFFYSYFPGITNPLSIHNFPLAYTDNDNVEYVGFWIKSIHTNPIIIKWGE
jgi:hypothetical protein